VGILGYKTDKVNHRRHHYVVLQTKLGSGMFASSTVSVVTRFLQEPSQTRPNTAFSRNVRCHSLKSLTHGVSPVTVRAASHAPEVGSLSSCVVIAVQCCAARIISASTTIRLL